ncbi:hypothetical protein EGW08_021272, partial [Elysia chlorotica]
KEKSPFGGGSKRSTPDSHGSSSGPTFIPINSSYRSAGESPYNTENAAKHFHSKYTGHQTPKCGSANTSGSLDTEDNGEENPSEKSGSGHSPMWKCYIKIEGPDHLLMTFVPSTFEDLLLLNPTPDPDPVPDHSDLLEHDLADPPVTAESLFGTSVEGEIFIRE